MNRLKKKMFFLCVFIVVGARSAGCFAQAIQVRSASQLRPRPALTLLSGLSLSTSTAALSFNLVPGSVSNTATLTLTTGWTALALGTAVLDIYGFLSSSVTALQNTTNAGICIPSSSVYGSVSGIGSLVSSFASFTQVTPAPASSSAGLHLINETVTFVVLGVGSQTNNVTLQINLAGQPQLPAGSYQGTLTFIAVAN